MHASTFADGLFAGKAVVVHGGTSGIGLEVGRAFADLGAAVTVTGATAAEADAARASAPGLADAQALDVRDDAAVVRFYASFSRLDAVVNCAGIIRRGAEHEVDAFAQVVDVNLVGTMRVCARSRRLLAASEGCIVNTASMLSFFGGGLVPGYSASKGGVAQLTKSLAIAYAADRVRVNAIAPGWIATALTEPLQKDPARSGAILARTPLGRWGRPEDVAGTVLFLCSPAAGFITGAVVPVDGGYLVA